MPEYDHGFKIITHAAGRQLAEMAGEHCTDWEPITSEVQTVERLADRAFRASRGDEHFVVYFEAYTYWEAAAPWSVLAKSALLSERERLPTVSLIFVLHPRGYRPQRGRLRLAVGGQATQFVKFREICLWRRRPQPWWEEVPGVMTLYPLCRHGGQPQEALAHAAGAIERAEPDGLRRANLLTVLGFFGRLAYPELDPYAIIGRERMKESPFYQQIMRDGAVATAHSYILAVLEERVGRKAAAGFAEAVNAIEDPERLDALLRLAARCDRPEDFRNALNLPRPAPQSPARRRRSPNGGG